MIAVLFAAQMAVVAHGPQTAFTCAPLEVTAAASAPGVVAPRLTLPETPSIQLLGESTRSRTERDGGGHPTSITEATFLLATGVAGRAVIPGIVAALDGRHIASAPVRIEMRPADDPAPAVLVRATVDDGHRRGSTDSVFVGQQVDYIVDVELNIAARERMRRNPTFFPPEMPSMLAYDLAPPAAMARKAQRCFETLSYRRALFPLFSGGVTIPPATLTYALPVSASFFSREESFDVRTDSVHLDVAEPPSEGRPRDFSGAVGVLTASSRIAASALRMGDPAVFTVRIGGMGNVKLLPRPVITVDWADVTLGEERVSVDSTGDRVRGVKEFDWLLSSRLAGSHDIPPLRYPYFDPTQGTYQLAFAPSMTVVVAVAPLMSADTAATTRLGIRRRLREERGDPIPSHPWFWLMLALSPAPAVLRRATHRRHMRRQHEPASRRLQRFVREKISPPSRELRRVYLDAVAERVPALGPVSPRDPFGRQLRRVGITDRTADAAESLLDRLDTAAFSPRGSVDATLVSEAASVLRAIDAEAVRRQPRAVIIRSTLILATLAVGASARAVPAGAMHSFDEGVRAYSAGHYSDAQSLFARAIRAAPRAVDSWANYGTSAWAAGDTAGAALGWQRALRLDPLDSETRDRMLALNAISVGTRGYVAPLPVDVLAGLGIVLWIGAWLALGLLDPKRLASVRTIGRSAIALAVAFVFAALEVRELLDPRGLGVVRASTALLESPTSGSASVGSASVGEVGRVGTVEGAWARISFERRRAGWIPASSILPLDASPAD